MAKQTQRRPTQPQQPGRPAQQGTGPAPRKTAPAPAPVRRPEKKASFLSSADRTLIYTRQNFIIMGIGLALIVLGLALMAGGAMPDPNVWEPDRIYSFQRITLAPLLMVAGFVVVAYGIFKRTTPAFAEATAGKPDAATATNTEA
jgi:uncharacterized membrane protein